MSRTSSILTPIAIFVLGTCFGAIFLTEGAPNSAFLRVVAAASSTAEQQQTFPTRSIVEIGKVPDKLTKDTTFAFAENPVAKSTDGKLRIICFGAHPDDCEIKAGGVAALWAAAGHHVKFVALTNGDIGHWREAGGPLAQRRNAEVQRAADLLGITTEVLDNHDGELMPTLENRRTIVRLIREWGADIVMGPRTNDYHPDHRYTGILVQDAAYMVAVPFFCPDTKPLRQNPVFMYFADHFEKPYPFQADVVIDIDQVLNRKLDALVDMESQFVEGGALGSADLIDGGDEKRTERRRTVREAFTKRFHDTAEKYRRQLKDWYGEEKGSKISSAEAFEICEYGKQPTKEELRKLFPFTDAR